MSFYTVVENITVKWKYAHRLYLEVMINWCKAKEGGGIYA